MTRTEREIAQIIRCTGKYCEAQEIDGFNVIGQLMTTEFVRLLTQENPQLNESEFWQACGFRTATA